MNIRAALDGCRSRNNNSAHDAGQLKSMSWPNWLPHRCTITAVATIVMMTRYAATIEASRLAAQQ